MRKEDLPSDATLRQFFKERDEEMLRVLVELVSMETPTGHPREIAAFVAKYRGLLEEAGLTCREIPGPAGPHLFGELACDAESAPPIVLVGHSDTVWPLGEIQRRPPRQSQGRLYGPGVYDMRAGLCVILFALRFLHWAGIRLPCRIQVFLAADEEVGSISAHESMEQLISPPAIALVPEPPFPDGSLKAERKGVSLYEVQVCGREAHAGVEPERGVNAILELVQRLLEITSWEDADRGLVINLGVIAGGTATNVIPGKATAGVDVRFDAMQDGEDFDRKIRALKTTDPRASFAVSGGIIFPPLAPDEATRKLHDVAIKAAEKAGLRIGSGKTGGGSDGSFLASRGIKVIDGLGVEGGGAHAPDEYITVKQLAPRGAFFAHLMLDLAALS